MSMNPIYAVICLEFAQKWNNYIEITVLPPPPADRASCFNKKQTRCNAGKAVKNLGNTFKSFAECIEEASATEGCGNQI